MALIPRVTHPRTASDGLHKSGFGNPFGNIGRLGATRGRFVYQSKNVLAVRRELHLRHRLPRPQGPRLARIQALLPGLVFFALLRAVPYDFKQLPLVFLVEFLGVGAFHGLARCGATAPTAPAAASATCRGGGRCRRACRPDIRQLLQFPAIQRQKVQVSCSREGDVAAIGCEARIGLRFRGLCHLTSFAGCVLQHDDVAILRKRAERLIAIRVHLSGRRQMRLVFSELSQAGAVAIHHPRIQRRADRLFGFLPLKVNALGVARPAYLRRLSPHQSRAFHDVVDREREPALSGGTRYHGQHEKKTAHMEMILERQTTFSGA